MAKIEVFKQQISTLQLDKDDYICWEQLNNSGFKPVEFDGFKNNNNLKFNYGRFATIKSQQSDNT